VSLFPQGDRFFWLCQVAGCAAAHRASDGSLPSGSAIATAKWPPGAMGPPNAAFGTADNFAECARACARGVLFWSSRAGIPVSRTPGGELTAATCLQGGLSATSEAVLAVTQPTELAPAASAPRRGSEYAELSRQVKQAGLLEPRSAYYATAAQVMNTEIATNWHVAAAHTKA
jgi:hypothetical protein